MDSLSQFALGAAVGVAVMRRRAPVWKSALWGGACGTLPDLDALIDYGDPIRDMTFHRAESHSLFYLTLISPILAWLISLRERGLFGLWWLATFLVLFTHPLLDVMTIYGTQLLQPFVDTPYGVGSIFIIDPLFTIPLIAGLIATGVSRGVRRHRWTSIGLGFAVAYLGWSITAQTIATRAAERSLAAQGIEVERLLVTATAFNTLLWRIVAMQPGGAVYHEGFYSLLDKPGPIRFDRFESDRALFESLRGNWGLERMAWFSHGFFRVAQRDNQATITDLRMGQEPAYVFEFAVAEGSPNPGWREINYRSVGDRGDVDALLSWLGPRIAGSGLPPPRTRSEEIESIE